MEDLNKYGRSTEMEGYAMFLLDGNTENFKMSILPK